MTYALYCVCSVSCHYDIRVCLHYANVQCVATNKGIKQQHTRLKLRACIEAKSGHFKLKLQKQVQNDCLNDCFKFSKNLSKSVRY